MIELAKTIQAYVNMNRQIKASINCKFTYIRNKNLPH